MEDEQYTKIASQFPFDIEEKHRVEKRIKEQQLEEEKRMAAMQEAVKFKGNDPHYIHHKRVDEDTLVGLALKYNVSVSDQIDNRFQFLIKQ